MRPPLRRGIATGFVFLQIFFFVAEQAFAAPQGPAGPNSQVTLVVQVMAGRTGLLSEQALVRAQSYATEVWAVTRGGRSEARFGNLEPGPYDLQVSAAGYATVVRSIELPIGAPEIRIVVVLNRDGSLDPITTPPSSRIPENARKEVERGIEAYKTKQFSAAEKHLRKAYKRAPENADLNYLLGVLYLEKKDFGQARSFLETAIAADPRHARALTTLGRVLLIQKEAAGAINYLQKSLAVDPGQWTAHWLLGSAYLRRKEFEKASQESQAAIEMGKGAGNAARLVLGQALAGAGQYPKAIEELETFLQEVPASPMAAEVRGLITQLQAAVAAGPAASSKLPPVSAAPIMPALDPALAMSNWSPPSIDDVKPAVAGGVACPQQRILEGVGLRVKELIGDLARFEAAEELIQEEVDEVGHPVRHETRKFSYVAEIGEPVPGVPRVEEYRRALSGGAGFPGGISSLGFPGLAFVFHPGLRDDFDLACEGLGSWQGQATWLVHFRQRENRPSRLLGYNLGHGMKPIDLKGRAWIAASTFQLVRIEAESLRPTPAVELLGHHVIADYGPVTFTNKNKDDVELWLPKKVELYFHFRGHRYHRLHDFENFRLFSVDSSEKVLSPKVESQP